MWIYLEKLICLVMIPPARSEHFSQILLNFSKLRIIVEVEVFLRIILQIIKFFMICWVVPFWLIVVMPRDA